MRIARIEHGGSARFAIVEGASLYLLAQSNIADLDGVRSGEVVPLDGATLLTPTAPSAVFAVGRNYAAHAAEMGFDLPTEPSVFMKPVASLLPTGGTVVLPPPDLSVKVEHEAELAIVIGRTARGVRSEEALDYVLGYTCANDISARDLQRADTHITRAKGFDTFCPLGPWIETDLDVGSLSVQCRVNGEIRQQGSTADLIFDLATIVSAISAWTTLSPGDVILTGSPEGTGPLTDGDQVEVEVEGIGILSHRVAASSIDG